MLLHSTQLRAKWQDPNLLLTRRLKLIDQHSSRSQTLAFWAGFGLKGSRHLHENWALLQGKTGWKSLARPTGHLKLQDCLRLRFHQQHWPSARKHLCDFAWVPPEATRASHPPTVAPTFVPPYSRSSISRIAAVKFSGTWSSVLQALHW